jgi:hypothetical protein
MRAPHSITSTLCIEANVFFYEIESNVLGVVLGIHCYLLLFF